MTAASRELLEAQMARDRQELVAVLRDFGARAREELDLRRRVVERPSAWLVATWWVGFWLGARR